MATVEGYSRVPGCPRTVSHVYLKDVPGAKLAEERP